jgi:hypothetical protein
VAAGARVTRLSAPLLVRGVKEAAVNASALLQDVRAHEEDARDVCSSHQTRRHSGVGNVCVCRERESVSCEALLRDVHMRAQEEDARDVCSSHQTRRHRGLGTVCSERERVSYCEICICEHKYDILN